MHEKITVAQTTVNKQYLRYPNTDSPLNPLRIAQFGTHIVLS
jgi:hypothetical protein